MSEIGQEEKKLEVTEEHSNGTDDKDLLSRSSKVPAILPVAFLMLEKMELPTEAAMFSKPFRDDTGALYD